MMINIYDLIQNENYIPSFKVINTINIDNHTKFDAEKTVNLLKQYLFLNELSTEHVYIVGYNYDYQITGIYCVGIGENDTCNIYNRNVAIFLLLSGSIYFRLFHNHPNNSLEISESDRASAIQLELIGQLLKIEFKGSYILTHKLWRDIYDNDPFGDLYLEGR